MFLFFSNTVNFFVSLLSFSVEDKLRVNKTVSQTLNLEI